MEARRSPRTITEEVYQDIRLKILQNKFAPNEHLVERRLAELYGVSKTPVREAITRLERDGLVKFISLKGAVVRRLEKPEIIQILDIREYLEALAGRKAAERSRSSVFIKEIEAAHALSLRYLDNIEEFQMHDRLLHTTIRKASGNQFLFDMSERLDDLFHIVLKTSMVLPTRRPYPALD